MHEDFSKFSEVPRFQQPKETPPFVPPEEVHGGQDMRPTIHQPGSRDEQTHTSAEEIARLLGHNNPNKVEEYLDDEDRSNTNWPPSSVTQH